jgi:hypothetical protein
MKFALMLVLGLVLCQTAVAQTWQDDIITLINEERANADERELAIYGELANGPRLPLVYHAGLEDSAQWWCDALKGSGWFDHTGYVNAEGYLINPKNNRRISRVWLPSYNMPGMTFWPDRNRFLELKTVGKTSENGLLSKSTTPEFIVDSYVGSGYNNDPRKASKHYMNVIDAYWTHVGSAKNSWGGGKNSTFTEFARIED